MVHEPRRLCLTFVATGGKAIVYHGGVPIEVEVVVLDGQIVVELSSRLLLYGVPIDIGSTDAKEVGHVGADAEAR